MTYFINKPLRKEVKIMEIRTHYSRKDVGFALAHYPALTIEEKHKILSHYRESLSFYTTIVESQIKREKKANLLTFLEKFDLEKSWEKLKREGGNWLFIEDSYYPDQLKEIYNPPLGLFYAGDITLLAAPMLSIVGSRKGTNYGQAVLKKLMPDFTAQRLAIVSGGARGIDTFAHREAIENNGKTIAVLGTGLNIVYPRENKNLQQQIAWNHLLLSEYPLDTGPDRAHFPMRNRIIAGLSFGTVVIEAEYRSGSLITSNIALNEGREVFAVPGTIFQELSIGTNDLIKHGAKLVLTASDVLEDLPL